MTDTKINLSDPDHAHELAAGLTIELRDVSVRFPVAFNWRGRPASFAHALNQVSLAVDKGKTIGILGESGCGKSTLAQVLLGLIKPDEGLMLTDANTDKGKIQIVFQDPQSSLNPRKPVWWQIMEPVMVQAKYSRQQLRNRAAELAQQVGLRTEHLNRYPHEFSGGQRQRIAIARALASEPNVIVLDEPTSALDISVQAQILNLLLDLQQKHELTYVLISHNVSVLSHLCDSVVVMYLGQVVESGMVGDVFNKPLHPYTQVLLESVPVVGQPFSDSSLVQNTELPSNRNLPKGCFYMDRCPLATTGCDQKQALNPITHTSRRLVRCHLVC